MKLTCGLNSSKEAWVITSTSTRRALLTDRNDSNVIEGRNDE